MAVATTRLTEKILTFFASSVSFKKKKKKLYKNDVESNIMYMDLNELK